MAERKTISKKIRFEVFKRDSFTCQYCGRMAPDIVLEVDHINAVANGGENDVMNLITSCFDCNRGKGKRKLSQKDEVKKQQEMLKELNSKREQLKMLLDWKEELLNFNNTQVDIFEAKFKELTGFCITEHGKKRVLKGIKEFDLINLLDSFEISYNQYYNGKEDSVYKVFDYTFRICNMREKQNNNRSLYYFNYLKKSFDTNGFYFSHQRIRKFINETIKSDSDFDVLKSILKNSRNWSDFVSQCESEWGCDI